MDGGDDNVDLKSKGTQKNKQIGSNQSIENDRFAATSTINGNNSNDMSTNVKYSSKSLIDVEKQNGNKPTNLKDADTIDSNSNLAYKVT